MRYQDHNVDRSFIEFSLSINILAALFPISLVHLKFPEMISAPLPVYITCVNVCGSRLKIWCQTDMAMVAEMEKLMELAGLKLNSNQSIPPFSTAYLQIGAKALVFSYDRRWHRAELTAISWAERLIHVRYVDTGQLGDVGIADIRRWNDPDFDIWSQPPLACEFVVAGVKASGNNWSEDPEIVNDLIELLLYQTCYADLLGSLNGLNVLELYADPLRNEPFGKRLISYGCASADFQSSYEPALLPRLILPCNYQTTVVANRYGVSGPEDFRVQLVTHHCRQQRLIDLASLWVSQCDRHVSIPMINQIYLAMDEELKTRFHRCQVLSVDLALLRCRICFVDRGDMRNVHLSVLREAPVNLMLFAGLAISCRLSPEMVAPSAWSLQCFKGSLTKKSFICRFLHPRTAEGPHEVELPEFKWDFLMLKEKLHLNPSTREFRLTRSSGYDSLSDGAMTPLLSKSSVISSSRPKKICTIEVLPSEKQIDESRSPKVIENDEQTGSDNGTVGTQCLPDSRNISTQWSEETKKPLPEYIHDWITVAKPFRQAKIKIDWHDHLAVVGEVKSPESFYIQLLSHQGKLTRLMNRLNNFYLRNECHQVQLVNLSANLPCVVEASDRRFYRAEVLRKGKFSATVILADFGRCDEVLLKDVKVITD